MKSFLFLFVKFVKNIKLRQLDLVHMLKLKTNFYNNNSTIYTFILASSCKH